MILRSALVTSKVASPLLLAKSHEVLLTLYPLELGILRGFFAMSKVAPPFSLAKSHELLLTFLSWGLYKTFW